MRSRVDAQEAPFSSFDMYSMQEWWPGCSYETLLCLLLQMAVYPRQRALSAYYSGRRKEGAVGVRGRPSVLHKVYIIVRCPCLFRDVELCREAENEARHELSRRYSHVAAVQCQPILRWSGWGMLLKLSEGWMYLASVGVCASLNARGNVRTALVFSCALPPTSAHGRGSFGPLRGLRLVPSWAKRDNDMKGQVRHTLHATTSPTPFLRSHVSAPSLASLACTRTCRPTPAMHACTCTRCTRVWAAWSSLVTHRATGAIESMPEAHGPTLHQGCETWAGYPPTAVRRSEVVKRTLLGR